ncbi:hypothetical protein SAMN05660297_00973 [Natronincola peptidivorans]|uniref:Uncharacterized protein n=1 Tax=Natronincola peptidivorans TaxID=426128 RepID=A0A1I0AMJ3_9FIRM|nr:hypothetical protein [Natronincola peptidivorans]SES94957.1 hypothetical protein SAMN05660297_00973 [Natronincola peptidivorans]
MKCPICGNQHTGKLSKSRYFCSICFIEIFYSKKQELQIFKILEDGSAFPVSIMENS